MATAIGSYVTAAIMKARAGITDTTDDALIGTICDQVNSLIEHRTQRVLAPVASTTYLFDGFAATKILGRDDDSVRLPLTRASDGSPTGGLRAVGLVEFAYYTTADYITLGSNQYFLRERAYPSGPYDALYFTDYPTSFISEWQRGYDTVRITATAGPAAIPDDIAAVAAITAVRAWGAVQSGQTDIIGTDAQGQPVISRFLSAADRATLDQYTLVGSLY